MIVDQTSKDPVAVVSLAKTLTGAGYAVEFRAVAVSAAVSEQRIHMRYESQKAAAGSGRFSTKDNHDQAYAALPASVAALEAAPHVRAVSLYDQSHKVVYANIRLDDTWALPPRAAEAMIEGRNRPPTLAERRELSDGYKKVQELMARPERRAAPEERRVVDELATVAKRELVAETFRQVAPAQAAEEFPELVPAYATMAAIKAQLDTTNLRDAEKATVMSRVRSTAADRIAKGEVPSVELKEARIQERGSDRER